MSQSLIKNLVHIVFSTKKRNSWLDKKISLELYPYIAAILKHYDCAPHKIGGVENHIHILCELSRNYAAKKVLEEIKTGSSKWIKTKSEKYRDFYWQNGYGVFSISPSHQSVVSDYIANQEEHHKKVSYENELIELFKKYDIAYKDEFFFD